MTKPEDMSASEIEALNAKTKTELAESVEEYEVQKQASVSNAIQHLIHVTESETLDIEFSGPAGNSTIKVMASPPQKLMEDLVRIGNQAQESAESTPEDEHRLCEILEYICLEPKIPIDVWMSGRLSDEIPARIIVELMKAKVAKHDTMVDDVESFRKDKRGAKASRGRNTIATPTE